MGMKPEIKFALLFTSAVLAVCIVFVLLNPTAALWQGMEPSQSILKGEYCEHKRMDSFAREPLNTWSNAAFLILGALVIGHGLNDRKKKGNNLLTQHPIFSFITGISMVYLFFGSGLFHASMTRIGQWADMSATYCCMVAVTGIALYRLFQRMIPGTNLAPVFIGLILLTDILMTIFKWHIPATPVMAGIILVITTSIIAFTIAYGPKQNLLLALSSLVCMVLAIILRTLDVQKIWCYPDSLIWQGHAVWHVLCALSLFLVYIYYRSENNTTTQV
jgi:hypothetical protein